MVYTGLWKNFIPMMMIINLFHQSHLQPFRLEIFLNLMLYENNWLKVELFSFFILLYRKKLIIKII